VGEGSGWGQIREIVGCTHSLYGGDGTPLGCSNTLLPKRGVRKMHAWTNTLAYMPPIRQMRYDQEEPTPASLENTCQRRRIIEKLTWGRKKTRITRECPQRRGPKRGKEDGDETIKARETGEREREERLRKGECASWVWRVWRATFGGSSHG